MTVYLQMIERSFSVVGNSLLGIMSGMSAVNQVIEVINGSFVLDIFMQKFTNW